MFALITPRANSTRNKNADKAAAVLSAKQASSGPVKSRQASSSGQVTLSDAARACL